MKPLTQQDKIEVFKIVTRSIRHYADQYQKGITDDALKQLLSTVMGIAGGFSGHDHLPSVSYQGSGLKIWASHDGLPLSTQKPFISGNMSLKWARQAYNIPYPNIQAASQLSLL